MSLNALDVERSGDCATKGIPSSLLKKPREATCKKDKNISQTVVMVLKITR